MKRSEKKIFANLFCFLTVIAVAISIGVSSLSAMSGAQQAVAAEKSNAAKTKHALKAYRKILKKKKNLNEKKDMELPYFSICDMNADGVPELIVSYGENVIYPKKYYTYKNGKAVALKGPKDEDNYPCYGSLVLMPSKRTYAFFRGGPAYDDEKGNGITPHILMVYKVAGHKIKLLNTFAWDEYADGRNKFRKNGKTCTEDEYMKVYHSLGKTIKFYPNCAAKRRLFV